MAEQKEINTVVMDLKTYTDLIVENAKLKQTLQVLKHKAESAVDEKINSYSVDRLDREQATRWFDEKSNSNLLREFADCSSWAWESLSNEYPIYTSAELKEIACARIRKMIASRLCDLDNEAANNQ